MKIAYAATLAFNPDLSKVALIQKNRPEWLAGKWNAIGGGIEAGEIPVNAAIRELAEEAGLHVPDYRQMVPFARIDWEGASSCMMYATLLGDLAFAQTKTDERVMLWTTATLPAYQSVMAPDLCALVEMAKLAVRSPRDSIFYVQRVSR